MTEPLRMSEAGFSRPGSLVLVRATSVAVLPWLGLLVVLQTVVTPNWPPYAWSGSFTRWASVVVGNIALFLPFLLFAGGSASVRAGGFSRRAVRIVIAIGIVAGVLGYLCSAVFRPTLVHRSLSQTQQIANLEEVQPFGPYTPAGLVRNLRFVEQNPPREFSLSTDQLRRRPPNVLLWELHRPIAMAVFGIINLFLGMLAAEATMGMRRPRQWNTRMAIGVIGAIAFYSLMRMGSPIQSFLRGDPMASGILAAWGPLALPMTQALLMGYLIWRRRS